MLYNNQYELSKNIASLIDDAIRFEVVARDEEIKSLKDKLKLFSKIEKENKELIRNNGQLRTQNSGLLEMVLGFNNGEILSVQDTSWQDGNECGDCWGEYKYTAKMKDGTERDYILEQ